MQSPTGEPHVPSPRTGQDSDAAAWHTLTADAVERRLETGPEGLSADEASGRLERHGPKEVEVARETPWWIILLHQFTDPLIYILLVAGGVTLLLGDYVDSGVIFAVVLINAVIGFVQEVRAQQAMRALASMAAPRATVVRGGEIREVASRELVPGDVVLLTTGVRMPADLRLISVRDMEVDESALTGESVPVRKKTDLLEDESLVPGDQVDMTFSGTVVTRGWRAGHVVEPAAPHAAGMTIRPAVGVPLLLGQDRCRTRSFARDTRSIWR